DKKNPGKGFHHSPRDTTQIAIARDPPRRCRALAKRHSCTLTKPTQAGRLESGCFPRDSLSCFGIRERTYRAASLPGETRFQLTAKRSGLSDPRHRCAISRSQVTSESRLSPELDSSHSYPKC